MVTDFGCNLNKRGGPVGVNHAHDKKCGEKLSIVPQLSKCLKFEVVQGDTTYQMI